MKVNFSRVSCDKVTAERLTRELQAASRAPRLATRVPPLPIQPRATNLSPTLDIESTPLAAMAAAAGRAV